VTPARPAGSTHLRVLVVDDDADHRLLLRRLFRRAGIDDVLEAADGEEALRVARAASFSLVVLDLAMPVLSGVDVLPALRDAAPTARIVVVSNFARRRLVDAVRRRGAIGYVQKDVPADRLVGEILLSAALTESSAGPITMSRFARDPRAPSDARRFVREQLGDGVEDLLSSVELLVSELVTNAVVHASSEPQVGVRVSPATVRVEVYDDVPTLPHRRTPDALGPGGRGLLLLDRIASRWGVDAHGEGKVVWFELDRG
jgi:DNA-binding NarL/FixJ family response regulator